MIALLRHGLLLGGALGAALLAGEIFLADAPGPEIAAALGWTPAYVAAGAGCGLLAALLARIAAPRRARERAPGVQIAVTVLALGAAALSWLPGVLAGDGVLTAATLLAGGVAAGAHLLGGAAAASRPAWLFASFLSPFSATAALLLLCAAALLARGLLPGEREESFMLSPAPPGGTPNLLLVVLEGVRADRLGCYGAFRAASPHLDQLAQEAVLFEQAFASSSEHEAALAGLLGDGTLAAGLEERGYRSWAGGSGSASGRALSGFQARSDAEVPRLTARLLLARLVAAARDAGGAASPAGEDELLARGLDWIRSGDPATPFAMVLHLVETGPPYDPPPPLRERFRPDDLDSNAFERIRLAQRGRDPDAAVVTAQEARGLAALHDAELLAADARIGLLVESLRKADLLEHTLLVVTADHGARFGEQGGRLGCAGSAHDAVLRVPLLARWPARLAAATRARGLVSLDDLAVGLLDLLDGGSGSALARVAAGEVPREAVIATLGSAGGTLRVVRGLREKFLLAADGSLLAAGDLLADPEETFLDGPPPADEARTQLEQRARGLLDALAGRDGGSGD